MSEPWDQVNLASLARGMVYCLPWNKQFVASFVERPAIEASSQKAGVLTPEPAPLTPEMASLTPEIEFLTPEIASHVVDEPTVPLIINELAQLAPAELEMLRAIAAPVATRKRAPPELVSETILALCNGRYLGLRVLAELLGKNPDGVDLRKRILKPLVNHGALQRAYPNPNDKRQAYTSCSTPLPGKIE